MKKLIETRLFIHSASMIFSTILERAISSVIDMLFEVDFVVYHILSVFILGILFFLFDNIIIKKIINNEKIERKIFGDKYFGGHWIELVSEEKGDIIHYCDLKIYYDVDKIYLSGTSYDADFNFLYNLETESASVENYGLTYIYNYVTGNQNRRGFGDISFHKKAFSSPDRYSGDYKGDDNGKIEGFLISDKETLENLDKDFLWTFKKIVREKELFLDSTKKIRYAVPAVHI